MNSDAMSAGVKPGGLFSRTEIRVLICYLLHHIKSPLPLDKVKERLHFDGIANFFEVAYAIADLEENGNIAVAFTETHLKYYVAAGECDKIAMAIGNSVPLTVREKAIEIAEQVLNRIKYERENKVTTEKTEHGIYVTCSVMENKMELVSVKLLVPDEESVNTVRENFFNNPVEVLVNATMGLIGTKI